MPQTATAEKLDQVSGLSRLPARRPAPRPPVQRASWLRWLYAARPSLMPTVYVPAPVGQALRR